MNGENLTKIYLIENTIVSKYSVARGLGKKRAKMRQNFIKLLKTHVEKMSPFRLAIML